jgi:hypothetical protein
MGETKCLLDHMDEIGKAGLSVCSIRLGLLPVALQMIDPKVNEISTLALWRPMLALLMSLGSFCATLEHERTGLENEWSEGTHETIALQPKEDLLWPSFPQTKSLWV